MPQWSCRPAPEGFPPARWQDCCTNKCPGWPAHRPLPHNATSGPSVPSVSFPTAWCVSAAKYQTKQKITISIGKEDYNVDDIKAIANEVFAKEDSVVEKSTDDAKYVTIEANIITNDELEKLNSKIKPISIKRTNDYHEEDINKEITSATSIRRNIKNINKIKKDEEIPLIAGIKALEIQKYKCCKKEAKINFLMKECGSYCPYCGVIYNEID